MWMDFQLLEFSDELLQCTANIPSIDHKTQCCKATYTSAYYSSIVTLDAIIDISIEC